MDKVRLGIIGLGHIGSIHIQAIKDIENLQITALCDTNPDIFNSLKKYISLENVQCYSDIELMIKYRNYDWIIVATPNVSHFQLASLVIENNIPIILEKPACQTRKQYYKLLHSCKSKNLPIYFALHAAYGIEVEYFLRNKEKIVDTFGEPIKFESTFYDFYIKNGVQVPTSKSLCNPWVDSGVNALSILSRLGFVDNLELEYIEEQTNIINSSKYFSNFVHHYKIKNKPNSLLPLVSGKINTSWNMSSSEKKTVIKCKSNVVLVLIHSDQSIIYIKNGKAQNIFMGQGNRLYNHYSNVFNDFTACVASDNFIYNNVLASNCHFAFLDK